MLEAIVHVLPSLTPFFNAPKDIHEKELLVVVMVWGEAVCFRTHRACYGTAQY